MDKLYDRIDWVNGTTPALNEDNLNAMSKGIDDIDDRVLSLGSAVLEVIPDLEDMLSNAQQLQQYRDDAVAAATSAEDDEEDAEAYAVGTRSGVPVTSGDPAYHNNAKYYSEQTNPDALANMTDVDISNPQAGEVLKYNSTSHKWENGTGGGGGGTAAQDVSYDNTTSGLTATNVQDAIDEVEGRVDTIETALTKEKMSSKVTCAIGATSATITDASIATTSIIYPYFENTSGDAMAYTNITVTTGQAVVSFAALTEATDVYVKITNL